MPICKGEATSTSVIRCREIAPGRVFRWAVVGTVDKPSIIDAVRVLIQENRSFSRFFKIAQFDELLPTATAKKINWWWSEWTRIANKSIHRNTSYPEFHHS